MSEGFAEICVKCHHTKKQGHAKNCPFLVNHVNDRLGMLEHRLEQLAKEIAEHGKLIKVLEAVVIRKPAKPSHVTDYELGSGKPPK
jgi:hypothetical protein